MSTGIRALQKLLNKPNAAVPPTAAIHVRPVRAAESVTELADQARQLAAQREHYVSHLSSNLDSVANGFAERPLGISFARAPHERMSSPTTGEPNGSRGVVFARVGGHGLNYDLPSHRQAVDAVVQSAIDGGAPDDAIPALRNAGISWVDNWNSIGPADELHALSPLEIEIRKILPIASDKTYKFPSPDSEMGIVVNGDWRKAATAGRGQPEVRRGGGILDGLSR